MKYKTLALAACFAVASATAGMASTFKINFTFTNGSDTVAGTVSGLEDNATSAATSVVGALNGGTLSAFVPDTNLFTLSNGRIIGQMFNGFGSGGATALNFTDGAGIFTGNGTSVEGEITFDQITAVPLPAGGLLLLTALAGIAVTRRKTAA